MSYPEYPIRRSVYTRGFYSPSPWAKAAVESLMDTPVVFLRHALVDDGGGNFEPAGTVTVWSTMAHVELDEEGGTLLAIDSIGPLNRRTYQITCPVPADPAWLPKRDDVVEFTDAFGRAWSLKIEKADPALNLPDHIEITTEAVE